MGTLRHRELGEVEAVERASAQMVEALKTVITESGLWQKLDNLKKNKSVLDERGLVLANYSPLQAVDEIVKVIPPDEDSDRGAPIVQVSVSDLVRPKISVGMQGGPDVVIYFNPYQNGQEIVVRFERPGAMQGAEKKASNTQYGLGNVDHAIKDVVHFISHEVIGKFPNNVLTGR